MEHLRARRAKIRQRLRNEFGQFKERFVDLEDEYENELEHAEENLKLEEPMKKMKPQNRDSVVTILLIKAKNLPLDVNSKDFTDAYIKFRLGNERYRSKPSWSQHWLEQFDLHLFEEDQNLELSLWNRNTLFGKAHIELSEFQRETTHSIWKAFEDCPGKVFLMITISGTTASETISDLKAYKEDPIEVKLLRERYRWHRSFENLRDVGHLTVKVFGANGLAATDIVLKSDPFCVLELGNTRLQTQTEHRTLTPTWNKIFTFNVKDITQCLEITVFDENRDHHVEFLGKMVIPLLRIQNDVKRWYTLKNRNLSAQAKGNAPQILLEMTVVWNKARAIYRAIQPKEEKLIQQEDTSKPNVLVLLRNLNRCRKIIRDLMDIVRFMQSCFEWESPFRSAIAFALWILVCWYDSLEIVPLVLLLIILKRWSIRPNAASTAHYFEFEEEDDEKDKDETKSIKERLQRLQEVTQTLQNATGKLASLGERIKNTFNFSIPELTWIAAFLLLVAFIVLHFVPIRFVLLIWGIIRFIRPLLHPNRIPNYKVLYFLSRVPNDEEFNQYRELQPRFKK